MQDACEKYEEWGTGFVLLVTSLMILWLLVGVWVLSLSSILLAAIFAVLFASVLFSAFYLTCRHCYYYGKKCYLGVGLVVPFFFKKVEESASTSRATLWFAHLLVALAYPLLFIFWKNGLPESILYAAVYLAAPMTAIALVSRYSCPHCKQTSCLSNPDRKKHPENSVA